MTEQIKDYGKVNFKDLLGCFFLWLGMNVSVWAMTLITNKRIQKEILNTITDKLMKGIK